MLVDERQERRDDGEPSESGDNKLYISPAPSAFGLLAKILSDISSPSRGLRFTTTTVTFVQRYLCRSSLPQSISPHSDEHAVNHSSVRTCSNSSFRIGRKTGMQSPIDIMATRNDSE